MRIDRLDLIAYGAFTGTSLDLSAGSRGLHLIVGPNEAGKSTTLRALRGWLFGFPHRLDDNFLHRNDALRVGGVLRDEEGQTLEAIRRKTLKRSLRGADDDAEIDEEILAGRLLGGVTEDLFARMFAIDHASLSAGGAAAMKAGGEFASILFGSGLDLAELRTYQKSLETQMDELFKPNGTNPRINRALRDLEEARRAVETASLKGADWTGLVEELEALRQRKAEVDRLWREVSAGRERLGRIRQAMPDLARREAILRVLAELADAPRLPDDFSARRREAEDRRLAAEMGRLAAGREAERLRAECDALPPRPPILDDADAVEAIQQALGAETQAAASREKLRRRREKHLEEARAKLADLGRADDPEASSVRSPGAKLKDRIAKLTNDALMIRLNIQASEAEIASARRRLADLARETESLPPLRKGGDLSRAVARVTARGDLSAPREAAVRDRAKAERELKALRAKLGDIDGPPEEIALLPVPPLDVIESFREAKSRADSARDEARKLYDETENALLDLVSRIEREAGASDLPDEEALGASRAARDERWKALRAALRRGESADDLFEPFEESTRQADGIADRLRREAERVAARAQDRARRASLVEALAAHRRRREDAEAEAAALSERWGALWRPLGLAARSPGEMAAWAQAHSRFVEKAEAVAEARERIARIDALIAESVAELHRELIALGEPILEGESLDSARDRASAVVADLAGDAAYRAELERDRREADLQLAQAMERLGESEAQDRAWKEAWAAATAPLGLAADATPERASMVLDATLALARALDEAAGLAQEIRAGEAEAAEFAERLASLAGKHVPDTPGDEPVALIEALKRTLRAAREVESRRRAAVEALGHSEEAIRRAEDEFERSARALAALAREAGTDDASALPEIERRSRDRASAEADLRETEARLRALAPGVSFEALAEEASSVDPASIGPELTALDEEFARLDEERQSLNRLVGDRERGLQVLQDSAREARAEAAAAEREHLLGALEADVERYVHLRLASAVLRGAIEDFREKNEAPVLRRASEHFARLTLGAFGGLRADLDEKDEPVLVGVRPDGLTRVGLSGMSVGTVDQLYLALKLASLEHYLATRPPMPLVVDDLLIQFDDARAGAALECLAELSSRTQVLFFTHHDHLASLARERLKPDVLFVHKLGARCA